jgi:hypothetical protein
MRLPGGRGLGGRGRNEKDFRAWTGRRTDRRRCSDLLIPTRGALVENSMEPSPTRKASIIAKANSSGAYEGLADAFFLMRTTTNREWANDHQIRQHKIVPHWISQPPKDAQPGRILTRQGRPHNRAHGRSENRFRKTPHREMHGQA